MQMYKKVLQKYICFWFSGCELLVAGRLVREYLSVYKVNNSYFTTSKTYANNHAQPAKGTSNQYRKNKKYKKKPQKYKGQLPKV